MFGGMMLFWVLLLIVVLVVLFRLVPAKADSTPPPRASPLERLQRRYARGEISTEEYERQRRLSETP